MRALWKAILLGCLLLVCNSVLSAQTPTWIQLPAVGGPTYAPTSAVYDAGSNRAILFGGLIFPPGTGFNDVWVLTNANGLGGTPAWQKLSPDAPNGEPSPRSFHSAVYDAANNRMIIFGGGQFGSPGCYICIFDPMFNDVWILNNANGLGGTPTWIPVSPAGGPPAPREGHRAVYDPATNRMVVFGGGNNGIMSVPNDTWVLTYANGLGGTPTWINLTPSGQLPPPLEYFAVGYDPASNRMTVFGGCCYWTNGTWLLTNANGLGGTPAWTQVFPAGPLPEIREVHAFGYDPSLNQLIIVGLGGAGIFYNDTWLLSSSNDLGGTLTWQNLIPNNAPGSPTLPDAGSPDPGVYASGSGRLILIKAEDNGQGGLAHVPWVLALHGGVQAIPGPTPPPPNSGPAQSPTSQQASASEPISTGNGNYYYQHNDFMIPGRGLPLGFQRSYNALDNYAGPLGANWTHGYNVILTQTAAGVATIRWGDSHGETFTLTGTTYVPQPGVFSTFVTNSDGTFTLTQKSQTKYNFSAVGKLTSIQDKNGNTITLSYDGNGNLVQITDTVGRNFTLSNDGSNRITQITDPINRSVTFQYDTNNNLIQATDLGGGITKYAYDSNHRVTSIIQPNGQTLLQNAYDSSGRVTSQSGGRGFATTLAYNTPGPSQTTITDARGNKTIHTYDSSLRIMSVADALGGTTSFTYDANNDRTSVTNQNGTVTNFSYDALGNVTGITDPLTNTVAFTYDAKNDLLTATNAKGKTTTFTYDTNGNLKTIQDALGNSTNFSYDSFGELSSKTDARGNSTAFLYDSSGNLTRITDALGHSTTLAYDGIGRLTSITDPTGHTATATFDMLSRLTKVMDPLSNVTQFAYDSVGNLLKITDAKGNATNYTYDATNNLGNVTDVLGHITQYGYDEVNNRISFKNAKGNTTSYTYDALNRLNRIADPLSFVTSYAYDAVGNVLSTTDSKLQTNQFTHDALNRLIGIAYADGKSVSLTYDANGNRTAMVDSHGTTAYAYDSLDRLVTVTHPGSKVVGYAYDAVGNRRSLTYPDGKVVNYTFDTANRLSAVTDWLARISNYSYDAANNLTRTAYPNGATITFSYDAANRLTRVINSALGLPLLNLGYALDAVGNRTSLNVAGITTALGYDPLNELTSAQLGPLKSTWTYDPVGNRLKEVSPLGTTLYTYDTTDRLMQAGTRLFGYDNNGSQTSATKTLTGSPAIYQYDAANRLIKAQQGTSINTSFAYDGDGNRVSQVTRKGTYTYVNDVATALPVVLQESGPDGNITYAYGLGLIEEFSPTFNYFYHYDGLGTTIALTNAAGKPAAGYVYDPWGNALLSITDSIGTKNKFRFTGEALDPETQLYYLRARYYDPAVGRLTSKDLFPGSPQRPLTLNKFAYVLNRPTTLSDPSGLVAETPKPPDFAIAAPGVAVPINANSTVAMAPQQPPSREIHTSTCIMEIQLPPWLNVTFDVFGFLGLPSLDPYGPLGGYYVPVQCTGGYKA